MSLLSVCTLANAVFAAPHIEETYYKDYEDYRLYQIAAKEDKNTDFELETVLIGGREAKGQGTPEKSPCEWLSLGSRTGHMF